MSIPYTMRKNPFFIFLHSNKSKIKILFFINIFSMKYWCDSRGRYGCINKRLKLNMISGNHSELRNLYSITI